MSHYKPYSNYKDSGIDWLGKVPEHWAVIPIKRVASLKNFRTNESSSELQYIGLEDVQSASGKYMPTEGNARQSEDSTVAVFSKGDVLYGKLRPYLKKAIVAEMDGICSTEFLVLDTHKVEPELLQKWLLTSDVTQQIESTCEGAKMPRADWEGVGNVPIPVPPNEEQSKLVEAINTETARIENLIAKKTRFIELLKEKRQALITHAVTKGLNPDVPTKDSGIEWIGEVPEHWALRKVAWDFKMTIGWTPSTKNSLYYGNDYNWVSIADLTSGSVNDTQQKITQLAIDDEGAIPAPTGSLLFSYKLTIGATALLENPAYTNEAIVAFHPNSKINMKFWQYASPVILPKYSRKNIYDADLLNQELINSARFFAPNIVEQDEIVACLDSKTGQIDSLIDKTRFSIELLKERRSAFITAAVTGQIDLREVS